MCVCLCPLRSELPLKVIGTAVKCDISLIWGDVKDCKFRYMSSLVFVSKNMCVNTHTNTHTQMRRVATSAQYCLVMAARVCHERRFIQDWANLIKKVQYFSFNVKLHDTNEKLAYFKNSKLTLLYLNDSETTLPSLNTHTFATLRQNDVDTEHFIQMRWLNIVFRYKILYSFGEVFTKDFGIWLQRFAPIQPLKY